MRKQKIKRMNKKIQNHRRVNCIFHVRHPLLHFVTSPSMIAEPYNQQTHIPCPMCIFFISKYYILIKFPIKMDSFDGWLMASRFHHRHHHHHLQKKRKQCMNIWCMTNALIQLHFNWEHFAQPHPIQLYSANVHTYIHLICMSHSTLRSNGIQVITLMNLLAFVRRPNVVCLEASAPKGTISFNLSKQLRRCARLQMKQIQELD